MTSLPDMAIDFAKEFGGAEGEILDSLKSVHALNPQPSTLNSQPSTLNPHS